MEERYYTTGEVAEILGVCRSVVIRLYNKGALKGFKHPGPKHHRRISESSLTDFLKREGSLSNPYYVRCMRETWEKNGFYPNIPSKPNEQTSK